MHACMYGFCCDKFLTRNVIQIYKNLKNTLWKKIKYFI